MREKNLTIKAFTGPLYATDGIEYVRTEPNDSGAYIGYTKTSLGEATVKHSSSVLHDVLSSGYEISGMEYRRGTPVGLLV